MEEKKVMTKATEDKAKKTVRKSTKVTKETKVTPNEYIVVDNKDLGVNVVTDMENKGNNCKPTAIKLTPIDKIVNTNNVLNLVKVSGYRFDRALSILFADKWLDGTSEQQVYSRINNMTGDERFNYIINYDGSLFWEMLYSYFEYLTSVDTVKFNASDVCEWFKTYVKELYYELNTDWVAIIDRVTHEFPMIEIETNSEAIANLQYWDRGKDCCNCQEYFKKYNN